MTTSHINRIKTSGLTAATAFKLLLCLPSILSIALFLLQGRQDKVNSPTPAPATGAGGGAGAGMGPRAGVGPKAGAAGGGAGRADPHQAAKRSSDDMAGGTNSGSGASKKQKQVQIFVNSLLIHIR